MYIYYYHRQNHVIIKTLHHGIRDLLQILVQQHMVCCKFNQIKRKTLYNCKSHDSINITMLHVSISRSSVIEHIPMFCIEMHNWIVLVFKQLIYLLINIFNNTKIKLSIEFWCYPFLVFIKCSWIRLIGSNNVI